MNVVFLFSSFSYQKKIHMIDKNNTFDNEVIW